MKNLLITTLALAALAVPAFAASTASPQTIKNLNAAFQGESNAASRYAAFSKKADQEGLT